MSIPDTNNFSLDDVRIELGLSAPTSLQACFDNANEGSFNATYKGAMDRLSNFRDYGQLLNIEVNQNTWIVPKYADAFASVGIWDDAEQSAYQSKLNTGNSSNETLLVFSTNPVMIEPGYSENLDKFEIYFSIRPDSGKTLQELSFTGITGNPAFNAAFEWAGSYADNGPPLPLLSSYDSQSSYTFGSLGFAADGIRSLHIFLRFRRKSSQTGQEILTGIVGSAVVS